MKDWAASGPDDEEDEESPESTTPALENHRDRDLPIPIVRVGNVARTPARFGKISGKASVKGPGAKTGAKGARSARGAAKTWAKKGSRVRE